MVATKKNPNQAPFAINVSHDAYERLTELSHRQGTPVAQIVDDLLREHFFKKLSEDVARLRADEVAWNEYQAEFAEWDNAALTTFDDE
jgi:hypothetical protein